MSYNIDGRSERYGNRVDSIFELKWQRRAYSAALFYSPERKLGGLQIRVNGFDWHGTGDSLYPLHAIILAARQPVINWAA